MSTNDLVTLTIGILLPLLVGLSVAVVFSVWNHRYEHESVTVRLGDHELTVSGHRPKRAAEITKQWTRAHTSVLQIPSERQSAVDRLRERLDADDLTARPINLDTKPEE